MMDLQKKVWRLVADLYWRASKRLPADERFWTKLCDGARIEPRNSGRYCEGLESAAIQSVSGLKRHRRERPRDEILVTRPASATQPRASAEKEAVIDDPRISHASLSTDLPTRSPAWSSYWAIKGDTCARGEPCIASWVATIWKPTSVAAS